MKPALSVVMSVRNHSDFLKTSIESILNQTVKEFEFLIIDDFSNDNSVEVLKEYQKQDDRIKLFFNTTNSFGLTNNLNFLIEKANSDIIARQDADDSSFPFRFETFLKKNNGKSVISTGFILDKGEEGSIRVKKESSTEFVLFNFLFFYYFGAHGQLFFKKQKYNPSYKFCQDYELCSSILRKDINDFLILDDPLYTYKKHENTIYKTYRSRQIYFSLTTAQKNLAHFLNINLPLHLVLDLRNFFLEWKEPKSKKSIFLHVVRKIINDFNDKYGDIKSRIMIENFTHNIIQNVL